jgi:hypothetical protein
LVIVPTEPDPPYRWIPSMLDPLGARAMAPVAQLLVLAPACHGHARPSAVTRRRPRRRARGARALRRRPRTRTGVPVHDLPRDHGHAAGQARRVPAVGHAILHQSGERDPDGSLRMAGMTAVRDYFSGLIAERRARPRRGGR